MKLDIILPVPMEFDLLFGGAVRDTLCGVQPNDYDFLFFTEERLNAAIESLPGFKCKDVELCVNLSKYFFRCVSARHRGVRYDLFLLRERFINHKKAITATNVVDITANAGAVDMEGTLYMDPIYREHAVKGYIVPLNAPNGYSLYRAWKRVRAGQTMSPEARSSVMVNIAYVLEKGDTSFWSPRYWSSGSYSTNFKYRNIVKDALEVLGCEYVGIILLQTDAKLVDIGKRMWNMMHGHDLIGRLLKFFHLWRWHSRRKGWPKSEVLR